MSKDYKKWCAFCNRFIEPENIEEFENGEHDGLIYVHDDVEHDDDYMSATVQH